MGIFGGRFKMGRPNPNIWVWVNRRLCIFGDHPLMAAVFKGLLKLNETLHETNDQVAGYTNSP